MAADSRCTSSHIHHGNLLKVRKIAGGYVGFAGSAAEAMEFCKWFRDGADPLEWPHCQNLTALVLVKRSKTVKCLWFEGPVPMDCSKYAAIGSGADFAMAAMYCGKTATEAVKVAIQLDPFSGGRVTTRRLEL